MKTLKEFKNDILTEESAEEIFNNCSEYFKEIAKEAGGSSAELKDIKLYRGLSSSSHDSFRFRPIRTNRKPLDTGKEIHEKIDNYFEEFYGISLRSASAQCSNEYNHAKNFGIVHVLLPVNGYRAFYNTEIVDFSESFMKELNFVLEELRENDVPDYLEHVFDSGEDFNTQIDEFHDNPPQEIVDMVAERMNIEEGNIVDALTDQTNDKIEIMLTGKGYYAIRSSEYLSAIRDFIPLMRERGLLKY